MCSTFARLDFLLLPPTETRQKKDHKVNRGRSVSQISSSSTLSCRLKVADHTSCMTPLRNLQLQNSKSSQRSPADQIRACVAAQDGVFLPDPIQSQGHINQLPINTVYISQIASLLSEPSEHSDSRTSEGLFWQLGAASGPSCVTLL